MPPRLLLPLVAALAVALLAAPAASAEVRRGPNGLAFCSPPSPLLDGEHG